MNLKIDIENKDEVIKWLEKIKTGAGDARPLWKAITPKINEFIDWQFRTTDDSAKRWKRLKPAYRKWKQKKGYFTTIGTMTGRLSRGAGRYARKTYKRKELVWGVNQDYVKKNGKEYARYFNKERPIYKNVVLRINSFLTFDVQQFENGSINSFTYLWLRKYLRKI